MPSPHFEPGSVIAGKYRVERVLGEGGMGIVLAARHLELRELVAVKIVSADVSRSPVLVERFRREARTLMRIRSEHVVRTHDIGRLDDGTPFLIMEYLEGEDLGRRIQAQGPLDLEQAVDFMMELCEALAHAHALSIVHRDLKPSNLFITQRPDGCEILKVIDFGIAKQSIFEETSAGLILTKTSQVIGSPRYMAPEQMLSARDVDVRADFWSVGVTLFELLSGHLPFTGRTLISLFEDVSTSEPPSLLRYRPELPEGIATIVHRCMQRDREARFPSVVELCAALQPFASPRCPIAPERLATILGRTSFDPTEDRGATSLRAPSSTPPRFGPGSTQQGFAGTIAPPKRRRFRRTHAILLLGVTTVALGLARFGSKWTEPIGLVRRGDEPVVSTRANPTASVTHSDLATAPTTSPVTVSDTAPATSGKDETTPIAVPSAATTLRDRVSSRTKSVDRGRAPQPSARVTATESTKEAKEAKEIQESKGSAARSTSAPHRRPHPRVAPKPAQKLEAQKSCRAPELGRSKAWSRSDGRNGRLESAPSVVRNESSQGPIDPVKNTESR
ncbi:MAG: protein kinase [Polyangiaceae bacterium]